MKKRLFLSMTALTLLATACAATNPDPAARRTRVDAAANDALTRLYEQAPGSRELVARAKGVLIFPSVVTASLVVGGYWGDGVLRSDGRTVGYYRAGGGTAGQASSANSQSVYVLFATQDALDKFKNAGQWTAGVDAPVAQAKGGAGATTDQRPVVTYVLANSGPLWNARLDGARIGKLDL